MGMDGGSRPLNSGVTGHLVWAMGAAVALLLLAGGVFAYRKIAPYGLMGSTYAAKQYCSCLFIAGRSMGSCKADLPSGLDRFSVSVDRDDLPERAAVSARLAIFSGRATYQRGYGCVVAR